MGLEKGADDYITKPFSLRELISRIRAHLRRAYGELSASGAKILRVGDLDIDQSSGKVRIGQKPVNLTPIGFRLLTYLALNRGQAISRSQLIEEVWGHAYDCESERIVDVQISRLRHKLDSDTRSCIIETVPGIGYRLTS